VVFLLVTQITKAIGAGGVINPLVAAWFPNVVFLFAGLLLLAKVRTSQRGRAPASPLPYI
jgi:lipopolysaccharide export LptBFGC system permease protein LptF